MKFLANALRTLNGVYRIPGSQVSTDRIDLEGSIQLVHNCAREAELAAGVGLNLSLGWWIISQPLGVAGAGVNYATMVNPLSIMTAALPKVAQQDVDCWLMDVFVQSLVTPNVITNCSLALIHASLPGVSGGSPQELIFFSSTPIAINNGVGVDTYGMQPAFKVTVPRYLAPGDSFSGRTDATAASANAIAHYLTYIGPKGTTAPGVA